MNVQLWSSSWFATNHFWHIFKNKVLLSTVVGKIWKIHFTSIWVIWRKKKKRKNLFCLRITRFQCPSVMTESLGFLRLESFGVSEGSLSMSFVIIRSIWGNVWNHWDSVFFMHSVLFSLSCTQVFHIACKYWNIDIV